MRKEHKCLSLLHPYIYRYMGFFLGLLTSVGINSIYNKEDTNFGSLAIGHDLLLTSL